MPQRGAVDWGFPITVEEVALMGRFQKIPWYASPGKEDRDAAMQALEMVRMADFGRRQIGALSGGQQQRVFMARALAQGSDILLLDEPFAGVDAATERAILDVLDRAKKSGKTLVVVSAVSMVGVILVVGLLITSAATAYLLCDRLDKMMALSALFGVTSVAGGLYLCVWLDSSGGGAVMLFCTLQFLVVLALAPKYGLLSRWMRLRNTVLQQVVEDVLTTVLRNKKPAPLALIQKYAGQGKSLDKVLKRMIQDGLLSRQDQEYALTDKGSKEAHTVLRAHRLWESYLESIGTPQKEVHPIAHRLEHLEPARTLDYLEKKLGSPETDPHGKPIPDT